MDNYSEEWKCVSRSAKNFSPRYAGPDDYLQKSVLNFRTVEYDVPFAATYAVILYPRTELLGKPRQPCDHSQNPECEPTPISTEARNLKFSPPSASLQFKD